MTIVAFSGINKDPEQLREKDQALLRLSRLASSTMKVPQTKLHLLAPVNSFLPNIIGNSDAQQVHSTITTAIAGMAKDETLLIYYVGQANE